MLCELQMTIHASLSGSALLSASQEQSTHISLVSPDSAIIGKTEKVLCFGSLIVSGMVEWVAS
jgi:hypothetical protein